LYVGNLPEGTGEHNLFELCGKLFPNEKIDRVRIKGRFCFVDFDNDIQHVLNGNPKLIVSCPWDDVVDLEIEAAKRCGRSDAHGGRNHQQDHDDSRGGGRNGRDEKRSRGGGTTSNALTSLYIANLPRDTFEEDLCDLFKDLCPRQKVVSVRLNGKGNKMYAHANFDDDVQHVLGGHDKLFSPCPWTENVVLEIEAAAPKRGGNDGGGKRAKHHHDSNFDYGKDRGGSGGEVFPSIYVRGLPRHTNSEHLSDLLDQLCPDVGVRRIWISKASGPNKKYAYVRLTKKADVDKVLGGETVKRVACLWESGAVLEIEEAKKTGKSH